MLTGWAGGFLEVAFSAATHSSITTSKRLQRCWAMYTGESGLMAHQYNNVTLSMQQQDSLNATTCQPRTASRQVLALRLENLDVAEHMSLLFDLRAIANHNDLHIR